MYFNTLDQKNNIPIKLFGVIGSLSLRDSSNAFVAECSSRGTCLLLLTPLPAQNYPKIFAFQFFSKKVPNFSASCSIFSPKTS